MDLYCVNTVGFKVVGTVMVVFLVIHVIIGFIMAPDTQGKSLKEIETERYGQI